MIEAGYDEAALIATLKDWRAGGLAVVRVVEGVSFWKLAPIAI